MDRKAWIVVTLCALLMGVNAWYMSKNATAEAQIRAEKAKIAKQQKELEAAKAAVQPGAAAANAPGSPVASKPGAPEAAKVAEETRELKAGSATFVLTTLGGGVKKAILAGRDQIVLNEQGREAICAFRRDATTLDDTPYKIVESTDKSVVFEGTAKDGLVVRKAYALTEGEGSDEHLLKMKLTLTNRGTAQVKSNDFYLYAGAAASLRPDDIVHPGVFWNDSGDADTHDTLWFGKGFFSEEKKEFSQSFDRLVFGGVMSRFYVNMLTAMAPPTQEKPGKVWASRFLLDHSKDDMKAIKGADQDYAIEASVSVPAVELAPNTMQTFDYEVYLGPKEYHRLSGLGGERTGIMFYGMAKPISIIFVNLMRWLHNAVGSWGWAIILMTISVRLATWPVFASSIKQGKRMSKLGPLMKEVQEKYKDDQQKQSEEMMKLYKTYGFNPLGCFLPMVIQILVFTGFFAVLKYAAELRGVSFWWVKDLSLPDTVTHIMGYPLNPLPLLMGASTILQMKLTPQAPSVDKSQQRMMMFMPVVFIWICYNFAAALALYYTTQNIFGIFQSWAMRKMSKDDDAPLQKVVHTPKGPPPQNPLFNGGQKPKEKDKKPRTPRLGG